MARTTSTTTSNDDSDWCFSFRNQPDSDEEEKEPVKSTVANKNNNNKIFTSLRSPITLLPSSVSTAIKSIPTHNSAHKKRKLDQEEVVKNVKTTQLNPLSIPPPPITTQVSRPRLPTKVVKGMQSSKSALNNNNNIQAESIASSSSSSKTASKQPSSSSSSSHSYASAPKQPRPISPSPSLMHYEVQPQPETQQSPAQLRASLQSFMYDSNKSSPIRPISSKSTDIEIKRPIARRPSPPRRKFDSGLPSFAISSSARVPFVPYPSSPAYYSNSSRPSLPPTQAQTRPTLFQPLQSRQNQSSHHTIPLEAQPAQSSQAPKIVSVHSLLYDEPPPSFKSNSNSECRRSLLFSYRASPTHVPDEKEKPEERREERKKNQLYPPIPTTLTPDLINPPWLENSLFGPAYSIPSTSSTTTTTTTSSYEQSEQQPPKLKSALPNVVEKSLLESYRSVEAEQQEVGNEEVESDFFGNQGGYGNYGYMRGRLEERLRGQVDLGLGRC